MRLLPCTVAVVALALVWWPIPVRCEVSVRGTAAAVRIDAHQATLPQVLTALEASLQVRTDTLTALDDIIISGTYSGALEDVLKRVLTGLNYVISKQEGAVDVIVVGRRGGPPAATGNGAPSPTKNMNPAAQWRKFAPPAQGQ
jgi:hypothetical protein